jgi:CDGSH iron-sulfur domain-containing protein 3
MATPSIPQKSPYVVDEKSGTVWFCACGRSQSQPYCDGSHNGTELGPMMVEVVEGKKVAWCGCKHSKNMPYCDGTHKQLI